MIEKKIAVLGGSTTNELVDQMELFLLSHGIKATFYQSEYGKYYEDAVFGNERLDAFSPDIVYIHTNWRNINEFPPIVSSDDEAQNLLQKEFDRFESVWESIEKRFGCPVIQNNFDRPDYRLLGNRDIWDLRGRNYFVSALNQLLYRYAREHNNFYINDIEYIASYVGMDKWNSPVYWHMYKYICDLDSIVHIAFSVANIIKSLYGRNKKLLAVDLDNTIWGGVVGDDGVNGLLLGNGTSKGEIYYAIQDYLKQLTQIGVVLAINSKNDYKNAIDGLHHPDSILNEDDFVSIEANWESKDVNFVKIAESVLLGMDSFVFMDDNPAERAIVSENVQGVTVPEFDKPENFISLIDHGGYFETTVLSEEDRNKTVQYKARAMAKESKAAYSDYGEYLDSLKMKADIRRFEDVYIQRIAQLTNKSNQFNLTTLRCTEDDIRKMQEDSGCLCFCGRLTDKFADNGIVTVVVGRIEGNKLNMILWLMSCRVLKRDLENAMLNVIVEDAKKHNLDTIIGNYYPTTKNGMVKDFYQSMGFKKLDEDNEGKSRWLLKLSEYNKKVCHMEVESSL
ncbi:MAG: HAD-IIIC family phosphatase [Butyrivibrio sp.]|nr:HAD-IIIC family phosphatase [Butyrivibrio sp.]